MPLSKLSLLPVFSLPRQFSAHHHLTSLSLSKSTSLSNPAVNFANSTHRKKKLYSSNLSNLKYFSICTIAYNTSVPPALCRCLDHSTLLSSQTISFCIPGLLVFFLTFVMLHFWSPVDDVFFITLADIIFVQLLNLFFKITLICKWYLFVSRANLVTQKWFQVPSFRITIKNPRMSVFFHTVTWKTASLKLHWIHSYLMSCKYL